jgi:hypothetical protein
VVCSVGGVVCERSECCCPMVVSPPPQLSHLASSTIHHHPSLQTFPSSVTQQPQLTPLDAILHTRTLLTTSATSNTMKQTILAIALHLLSASQTSAFTAPITTVTCQSSTTACSVWKKKKNPNNPNVVFPVSVSVVRLGWVAMQNTV